MKATLAQIVAESCDSSSILASSSSFAFLGDGTTREGGLSGMGAAGPRAACLLQLWLHDARHRAPRILHAAPFRGIVCHLGLCRRNPCHSISPHSLAMTCA